MPALDVRRLVLDVDKAIDRPGILEIAAAIHAVSGVEATNITVTDIDLETVGMNVTIQGVGLSYEAIERAIENTGAVCHSIDEIGAGQYLIGNVKRSR
jgi:hypothetical protein